MKVIKEGLKWAFILWIPIAIMASVELFFLEGNSPFSTFTAVVVLVLMAVAWLNIDALLPEFAWGLISIYLGLMILGILSASLIASLQRMKRAEPARGGNG
jgi:hypothetical protein